MGTQQQPEQEISDLNDVWSVVALAAAKIPAWTENKPRQPHTLFVKVEGETVIVAAPLEK